MGSIILANIELGIGYAICVLFPLPWVNRFIIDLWAKLFSHSQPTDPTT